MPATILIGAQWGDEGKGRVVDWLAAQADIVARYSGGDNAGHTVVVGQDVFKLHLIPSGILHEHAVSVLGNGMVINPIKLLDEIDKLAAMGVDISPERLVISTRAHIITPAHVALDAAEEKARGDRAVGTTLRGIGPAYLDKAGRQGIRAGQMAHPEEFADTLHGHIENANQELLRRGHDPIDSRASAAAYVEAAARLKPFLRETAIFLNDRLKTGAPICEGRSVDIDHGSYPLTSWPTRAGADRIGDRPCIDGWSLPSPAPEFTGPMPTEPRLGDRLRGTGEHFDEFGTTTDACAAAGWAAVMLRYWRSGSVLSWC
jgi:adenylosuccinate synthase